MGVIKKTACRLGLIAPKFCNFYVLHEDYLSFKSFYDHFRVPNCEMFKKNMKYFIGVRYDYYHENEDLRKK